MSKKRIFFYLFCVVLISVLLRTPTLFVNFHNIDENEVALAGRILVEGGVPYRDYMIYQPPLLYYFYAFIIKLIPTPELGDSMWWAHVMMLLVVALICIAVFFTGKEVYKDPIRGLFAALFFATFSTTFLPQDMLSSSIELFMILPMTFCALFFFKERYFISGIFLGLTILTKYQGGILLPALAVTLFWQKRLRGFLPLSFLCLGAALVGGGWIYYLYSQGALPDAIRSFFYILAYAKGPPGTDFHYITLKFLLRTFLIGCSGFGLWYFAIRGIGLSWKKPSLVFTLWVLFGFTAVITGGRMYFHYYLILYPALALLAGDWAGRFFEGLQKMPFARGAWRLTIFILMIFIPVTGFTAYATYKPFRPKMKDSWIYVVDYIRDRTGPKDPIFVWGYCPQIYTISNRPMATRFTTSDYLTGRSPKTAGLEFDPELPNPPSVWKKLAGDFTTPKEVIRYDTSKNIFPGGWNLLMGDLEKNRPVLIVDTSPSNYRMYGRYPMHDFKLLNDFVERNYVFEATIRGMDIYRRKK